LPRSPWTLSSSKTPGTIKAKKQISNTTPVKSLSVSDTSKPARMGERETKANVVDSLPKDRENNGGRRVGKVPKKGEKAGIQKGIIHCREGREELRAEEGIRKNIPKKLRKRHRAGSRGGRKFQSRKAMSYERGGGGRTAKFFYSVGMGRLIKPFKAATQKRLFLL
jgi:hypothetical protein